MKKAVLIFTLLCALLMGINPADFDNCGHNDHQTFALMAAAWPQNNGERQPCWGSDKLCPDGKYRDFNGNVQPNTCNNYFDTPAAEKCSCHNATDPAPGKEEEECAAHNGDRSQQHDGTCRVYCRGQHCHCINSCDT